MFIDRRGPAVTSAQIDTFETQMGIRLPSEYRSFLATYNGGVPCAEPGGSVLAIYFAGRPHTSADVRYLLGLREEYSFSLSKKGAMFSGRIPEGYLPIGSTSGGDLYLLFVSQPTAGHVAFWDHENEAPEGIEPWTENVVVIAASFSAFLNQLEAPRRQPY